ncbi:TadE family protein [Caldimonas thermodepolymerans]|jgi:Flp pilus assembly protein TadG|uniref:TadE family protein n=1 Tax=Caldimonas thermodepolymerans TaxID=215580 RepID=UPI002235CDA4|nr:TadE family protein [Caldimonas thermodepolymerans]UZG44203.1 pilus assembly protein [Caldimonas thermodepolymerans]
MQRRDRHRPPRTGAARRARGAAAVEFAIVFLAFFMLLWGILTYGFAFAAQQIVTLAAQNGVRAALRYQPATNAVAARQARTQAARAAARESLDWLTRVHANFDADAAVTAAWTTCPYQAQWECVSVAVRYPYAERPLIPPLPGLQRMLPDQLTGSATMQVDPDHLLTPGT